MTTNPPQVSTPKVPQNPPPPKPKYGTPQDVDAINPDLHWSWKFVIVDAQVCPTARVPLIRANSLELLAKCFSQFWNISNYTQTLLRTHMSIVKLTPTRICAILGKQSCFNTMQNIKQWPADSVNLFRIALLAARDQFLSERQPTPITASPSPASNTNTRHIVSSTAKPPTHDQARTASASPSLQTNTSFQSTPAKPPIVQSRTASASPSFLTNTSFLSTAKPPVSAYQPTASPSPSPAPIPGPDVTDNPTFLKVRSLVTSFLEKSSKVEVESVSMKNLTLSVTEALGFKDDVRVIRKYVTLVVDDHNKETKKAPKTSVASSRAHYAKPPALVRVQTASPPAVLKIPAVTETPTPTGPTPSMNFAPEVSSDDVPIGSDDVPMTDDVPIALKRQRECTPPPANSLKTPPANCLKTRPCKWFGQGGGCKRGFTCHFAHDEKDVIARKNSAFRQT